MAGTAARYKDEYGPSYWEDYCNKDPDDYWCKGNGDSNFYCKEYDPLSFRCSGVHYPYNVACTVFFLLTFGIGIVIMVVFSKFPRHSCCDPVSTTPVMVGGQAVQMQTMQRMPNGQLVMVQNQNVGVTNSNYVIAQQPVIPETVQYTTQTQVQTVQTVQQPVSVQVSEEPAVQQPITQQNDLPPS